MKVFVYNNTLVLADKIESFNKWLTSKGKLPIKNPNIQDVPSDAVIKDFENGVFSESLYDARMERMKEERYGRLVEKLVLEKYSDSAEKAMLRQRDTKPLEFAEYFAYVEECKARARIDLYGK